MQLTHLESNPIALTLFTWKKYFVTREKSVHHTIPTYLCLFTWLFYVIDKCVWKWHVETPIKIYFLLSSKKNELISACVYIFLRFLLLVTFNMISRHIWYGFSFWSSLILLRDGTVKVCIHHSMIQFYWLRYTLYGNANRCFD